MPSPLHETLIEMFRHRPTLAAELLDTLGLALPAHDAARAESADLPDLAPTEYRADNVVRLLAGGEPVGAIIVEVQLRPDPDKRYSWPVYVTTLRARLRCPVVLLVVCVEARTAAWCAGPIELGHPGARLVPVVLGPDRVPVVDDPVVAARTPEMAVLSAMAHGSEPGREGLLDALVAALASTDSDHALLYADIVRAVLPATLLQQMEARMKTAEEKYASDFARRYYGQGLAEGQATALIQVLEARRVPVADDVRLRIVECRDLSQLAEWLRRAVVVESADELFA